MTSDITIVLIVSMITILLLIGLTIYLFTVFYKSKSRLQKEKNQLEAEVSKSQLEIREEFMRNVGKELHDNVGQVLSTVKLQLSMSDHKEENEDSIALIGQSLSDIRNLSKVVDPDAIKGLGLLESCRIEINRLDRLDALQAEFNIHGKAFNLDRKIEIIMFRIIQESLNNCIKHAQTDKIDLSLHFDNTELMIILIDQGVGFNTDLVSSSSGSGLRNMRQRAEMIGASFKIISHVGKGTTIEITYKEHPSNEQDSNRHS